MREHISNQSWKRRNQGISPLGFFDATVSRVSEAFLYYWHMVQAKRTSSSDEIALENKETNLTLLLYETIHL
jgi:hypothetical protein